MRRTNQQHAVGQSATEGRLLARPRQPTQSTASRVTIGEPYALGLDHTREALIYVPAGYHVDRPAPLALMLHGAGGNAQHGMALLQPLADRAGLILLAPASRRQTWDVIFGQYGPDVDFIDRALTQTFDRYAVDPSHITVGGFSDGASYALSLGITNGDLFTHVIAFSPGFMAPSEQHGSPGIFISHGVNDSVLPIASCSRRIVPNLRRAGYDVFYREFDGPHTVPPDVAREAVAWFEADEG